MKMEERLAATLQEPKPGACGLNQIDLRPRSRPWAP